MCLPHLPAYKSMSCRHTSCKGLQKACQRFASSARPGCDKNRQKGPCSLSLELFDSVTYTVCQGGHRKSTMKSSAGAISRQALVFFLLAHHGLYRYIGRIRISSAQALRQGCAHAVLQQRCLTIRTNCLSCAKREVFLFASSICREGSMDR